MARRNLSENKLTAARGRLEDAREALEREAGEAGVLLARWQELALLYRQAAQPGEEVRARQAVLDRLQTSTPTHDPAVLEAKVELAIARLAHREALEASALLSEALAHASVLPPELVLRTRHAQALALFELDEPLPAAGEIEVVLAERVTLLPPDDALLLETKLDAARIRRANGDLEGARLLLEEVVVHADAKLERVEVVEASVELAEANVAVGSLEGLEKIDLSALEENVERVPSKAPQFAELLGRLAALGARVFEVSQFVQGIEVASPPGSNLPPEFDFRRRLLIASFQRLRPPDRLPTPALEGRDEPEEMEFEAEIEEAIPRINTPWSQAPVEGRLTPGWPIPGAGSSLLDVPYAPMWTGGLDSEVGSKVGTLITLVNTARQAGQLLEALGRQQELVSQLEKHSSVSDTALFDARLELANDSFGFEGTDVSLETLDEILADLEQGDSKRAPDDPALVDARWQLALTKRELGDLEGAQPLLLSVLAAREELLARLHPDLHDTLAALAWNELELGLTSEAHQHLLQILARLRERMRASWALAPREARELARVELRRLADALSLLDALGGSALLEGDVFVILEGLRLVSGTRAVSAAVTPGQEARQRELARLHSELADLCQVGPGPNEKPHEWSARVRQVRSRLEALGQELSADPAFEERLRRLAVDSLRTRLGPQQAYLGFWRNSQAFPGVPGRRDRPQPVGRYTAFVLTTKGCVRVDLGSSQRVEELVFANRTALRGGRGQPGVEAGPEPSGEAASELQLADFLLAPLREHLEGIESLYLCLDDLLFLVPLEALPTDDGRYLGDRYRVQHELSLARLLEADASAPMAPASAILCGGIDYDAELAERAPEEFTAPLGERSAEGGALQYLPGTAREVADLSALFASLSGAEARVLTGQAATKSALREGVAGARYVHLATHGWFAPEGLPSRGDEGALGMRSVVRGFAPMVLCGLGLAGANRGQDERGRVPGILTAEELAGFDLSSAELVVLSACETGIGLRRHGQGIQSLQTALFAAGARRALTSLWRVDDAATATFMQCFYEALWRDQLSPGEALRRARRTLRERGHPARDWAAWVLYGPGY